MKKLFLSFCLLVAISLTGYSQSKYNGYLTCYGKSDWTVIKVGSFFADFPTKTTIYPRTLKLIDPKNRNYGKCTMDKVINTTLSPDVYIIKSKYEHCYALCDPKTMYVLTMYKDNNCFIDYDEDFVETGLGEIDRTEYIFNNKTVINKDYGLILAKHYFDDGTVKYGFVGMLKNPNVAPNWWFCLTVYPYLFDDYDESAVTEPFKDGTQVMYKDGKKVILDPNKDLRGVEYGDERDKYVPEHIKKDAWWNLLEYMFLNRRVYHIRPEC